MSDLVNKMCTKCNEIKAIEFFVKHSGYKDGYCGHCRGCLGKQASQWSLDNKVAARIHNKKSDKKRVRQKASWKFKDRYGITIEIYEQMVTDQKEICLICKKHQSNIAKGKLFVDHCHKTGTVRGLLCNSCNHGLGQFRDNIEFLKEAIKYLERPPPIK